PPRFARHPPRRGEGVCRAFAPSTWEGGCRASSPSTGEVARRAGGGVRIAENQSGWSLAEGADFLRQFAQMVDLAEAGMVDRLLGMFELPGERVRHEDAPA